MGPATDSPYFIYGITLSSYRYFPAFLSYFRSFCGRQQWCCQLYAVGRWRTRGNLSHRNYDCFSGCYCWRTDVIGNDRRSKAWYYVACKLLVWWSNDYIFSRNGYRYYCVRHLQYARNANVNYGISYLRSFGRNFRFGNSQNHKRPIFNLQCAVKLGECLTSDHCNIC